MAAMRIRAVLALVPQDSQDRVEFGERGMQETQMWSGTEVYKARCGASLPELGFLPDHLLSCILHVSENLHLILSSNTLP